VFCRVFNLPTSLVTLIPIYRGQRFDYKIIKRRQVCDAAVFCRVFNLPSSLDTFIPIYRGQRFDYHTN